MTLRLPAEYEPQAATWLSWPGNPETWVDRRREMEGAYADFVACISRFQPVRLICQASWQADARRKLDTAKSDFEQIEWIDLPTNDAWCRDHGPLFLQGSNGLVVGDLPFNAWGGKFPPWDDDDAIPNSVSELRKLPHRRLPILGEGGAIEVNARGELLTTESVWLNPNRNPRLTIEKAEEIFAEYFGVKRTTWLPQGLIGDDTDGHIDTLSRFTDDNTVVTAVCEAEDPNHAVLERNRAILEERFTVVPLPQPAALRPENWREAVLPATYANFLILNDAVLVPTYRQPDADARALGILQDLLPTREVLGLDSFDLILEGGALHCLSMQEPRPGP